VPVIPPDESVGLNALSRLARGFEAAVFLAVTFFAGAFFAGAFAVAVFLAVTFFAGAFFAGAFAVTAFLAATFFAGAFLAATFFAGAFFAGAFFADALASAVFVFLTDACLLERVLVVTGFFAPVEAAFFFAAGLAFADVFLGAGCFDALAAD